MTKPSFNPSHQLSRLDALTNTASTALARAEANAAWYKTALQQKTIWTYQIEAELGRALDRLFWWRFGCVFFAVACATALASRWL